MLMIVMHVSLIPPSIQLAPYVPLTGAPTGCIDVDRAEALLIISSGL